MLLRALKAAINENRDTMNQPNALNASMVSQMNQCLDQEELLTEEEIEDKERIISALLYKSEINLAVVNN